MHLKKDIITEWDKNIGNSRNLYLVFWSKSLVNSVIIQYTMIGNKKFEPFTLWNDIELRNRITASQ